MAAPHLLRAIPSSRIQDYSVILDNWIGLINAYTPFIISNNVPQGYETLDRHI